MTTFPVTQIDTLTVSGTGSVAMRYPFVQADGISFIDSYTALVAFFEELDEALALADRWLPQWTTTLVLHDTLKLIQPSKLNPTGHYGIGVDGGRMGLRERLGFNHPVVIAEHLRLSEQAIRLQLRLLLKDTVRLGERVSRQTALAVLLAEHATFGDRLSRALGAVLSSTLGLADSSRLSLTAYRTLLDRLILHDTMGQQLNIVVVESESFAIAEADVLQMVYHELVNEQFGVHQYIEPGQNITSWAMNIRTGAVSEYLNYAFNSFAKLGDQYIAASPDGLFELLGNTDDGEPIVSSMMSGLMDVAGSNFTSFQAAYLAVRGGGKWYLKLVTGDNKQYVYGVSSVPMKTTRVNLGKGLRARYFSFELISTGQDFDFDALEFLPIASTRRV